MKIDDIEFYSNIESPDKITENIFQGGYKSSENKELLKSLLITHILVVSSELSINFPDDFQYLRISINDDELSDIKQHFEKAFEFIDNCINNNGKILIHCAAGISRSSTITCSYLMKKNKITYKESLEIVRKGRKISTPNSGFEKQLLIWQQDCL